MAAAEGEKKMITPKVSSCGEEEAAAAARGRRAIRRTIEGDRADTASRGLAAGSSGRGRRSSTAAASSTPPPPMPPRPGFPTPPTTTPTPTTRPRYVAPSGGGLRNRDAGFAKATQPAERDCATANPAAAHPLVPFGFGALRHHQNIAPANRRPAGAARRAGLLINFGAFLVCSAGSFILFHTAGDPSDINDPTFALVAFLFVLLGVWFALLALIADQFPGAARVAVAIARALKGYLLSRGN